MHSSRMRTVRSSDRISGGCLLRGGCLLWGGLCSWGMSAPGGCLLPRGCLLPGGCLLRGGSAPGGVSAPGEGVCSWGCGIQVGRHPHRPCGQTDACKNRTFATLLRTANISLKLWVSVSIHRSDRNTNV